MDSPVHPCPIAFDDFEHPSDPDCPCDLCHMAEEGDADVWDATLDFDTPEPPLPWEDAFEPVFHCLAPERPLPHRKVAG
jgi:hypothetical protein